MRRTLLFGEGAIDVEFPDRTTVVGGGFGTKLPALPDLAAAIRAELDAPRGLPPLGALVRPGASVLVAFDDPTVPSFGPMRRIAIEEVLGDLERAGVPQDRVTLLCANSLHRKWRPEELARVIGEDLVRRFGDRLRCHDAEDRSNLAYIGRTPGGWEVEVHREVVEADLTVYVNASCIRGFSGGWKSVCVGLSTWRSIRAHHTPDGMTMSVEGNRMHAMLGEMGTLLERATGKRVFKIETIPAGFFDVARVFAGGVAETRADALEVLTSQFRPRREAAPPADVVVYGVPAWSPYATFARMNPILTLLSSGLGYFGGVIEALGKPGCTVVLATPCPDGWDDIHHPSYREVWDRVLPITRNPWEISARFAEEFATHEEWIERYRSGFAFHPVHGILATHPLKRLRHAGRVFVAGAEHSRLPAHLGFEPFSTVEDAIARAEQIHGAGCAVTCVQHVV